MLRKDHILKLIQQLDKLLKKVAHHKQEGDDEQALQELQQAYVSILEIDIQKIPVDDPLQYLSEDIKLDQDQLNVFAELLKEEGDLLFEQQEMNQAKRKYALSLDIFEYLNEKERIFSFEREAKITWMMGRIKILENL